MEKLQWGTLHLWQRNTMLEDKHWNSGGHWWGILMSQFWYNFYSLDSLFVLWEKKITKHLFKYLVNLCQRQLELTKPMGSVYDILFLILYIECNISYKYLKLCSNIWIRVGILFCIYVMDIFNFQENEEWRKGWWLLH